MKRAFQAIDDWNYGYIDHNNLKRFLRSTGVKASKQDLVGILRRFDMDGDAKISFKEFETGMKSSLTAFGRNSQSSKQKLQRPKSGIRLQNSPTQRSLMFNEGKRVPSAGRQTNTRRRETELNHA